MKLSVIIPNYNHGHFINEQIESIVNQTYKCHEIIIIDDKSTDNSVEIINKIIDKYPFIKLIQNKKNIGPKDVNDSQVLHCVNAKKYSLTTYKGLEVTIIL